MTRGLIFFTVAIAAAGAADAAPAQTGPGAPGPTVAGGMLFVPSGYVGLGNGTPGHVLLAFGRP